MIKYTFNRELPLCSFEFKSASLLDILSRRDIEQKLIRQAWQDELFKIRLLNAPKETLEHFFTVRLPESMSIEVLEETDTAVYLVLPHNPYMGVPEPELKKALGMDLEDIAGWMLEQQKGLLPEDRNSNILMVARAWRDADFKLKLLASPQKTLEQELGLEFREDSSVRVLEESADKVYIVIPHLPNHIVAESEADLGYINLPIVIGSASSPGNDTFALECTQAFACLIVIDSL